MTKTKIDMTLAPEDQSIQTSNENFLHIANCHGLPVGAIHRIAPGKNREMDHTTTFFFFDGFTHDFYGFKCGTPTKENKMNIIGLIDALLKIPFIGLHLLASAKEDEEPYIYQIGTEKILAKYKNDFMSLNYIFRPPSAECPEYVLTAKGTKVMDHFISLLASDPYSELFEGEW